jgi:RNA polymerase sigma factor (TIGR02999 family)
MQQEGPGHTLQTTALVHEAYLRLLGDGNYCWQDRSHFFSVIAQTMRRILVDYARGRRAEKRGGDVRHLSLEDVQVSVEEHWDDVILVNDALTRLAAVDERHARLVELRFFAGLTVQETAEVLGVSGRTVTRDWDFVQAWLYAEITRDKNGSDHDGGQSSA